VTLRQHVSDTLPSHRDSSHRSDFINQAGLTNLERSATKMHLVLANGHQNVRPAQRKRHHTTAR
jgi:hypothetical protein